MKKKNLVLLTAMTSGVMLLAACAQTPEAKTDKVAAPAKEKKMEAAPVVMAPPMGDKPVAIGKGFPAEVLGGLKLWKVTMPSDDNGDDKADEVKQPDLMTYANNPYFRVTPEGDGVVFRAIAGGARTSKGTAYPRSELREMTADVQNADWECTTAKRGMYIEQAMIHSTVAKSEATIGQIHDKKNDNLMIKYDGPDNANGVTDTGKIEVRFNNDSQTEVLDEAYTLGQPMSIDVNVEGGAMQVTYKNLKTGVTKVTPKVPFKDVVGGCYFKAGMYIQACSKTDIYGKVNETCAKKGWPASRYDDPKAYAEMLIRKIELR